MALRLTIDESPAIPLQVPSLSPPTVQAVAGRLGLGTSGSQARRGTNHTNTNDTNYKCLDSDTSKSTVSRGYYWLATLLLCRGGHDDPQTE